MRHTTRSDPANNSYLNPLITATVEATEEAILNALTMATTVTGRDDRRIDAIELLRLKSFLQPHRASPPLIALKSFP